MQRATIPILAATAALLRRLPALLAASLLLAGLALGARPTAAAPLEGVLSPGEVIRGHEKNEGDCTSCHVKFDKNGQDLKCLECHKEQARDLRDKTGYHGKIKRDNCRTCHTDHKGRDARIVVLDEKKFDHALSNYLLKDKHQQVDCAKCHVAGKKYREAPHDCISCHRKDDVHKGKLGTACADCHTERSWKDAKFDHDKSRFPLRDKHVDVKCEKCHLQPDFRNAPLTCIGCHRKDDKHKARFGEKCETCHTAKDWKGITFDHDRDTKYPLRGKHHQVKCESCHAGDLYRDKLQQACIACHRKDDKHKGTEGEKCGDCHTEKAWKDVKGFDHNRTKFPLKGKHEKTECNACHKTAVFTDAPKDCYSCHQKDDKHKGQFGPKCESCHNEAVWKTILFDHDRDTKYALKGKHRQTKCTDCHTGHLYNDKLKSDCIACHRKDDKHKGQEGERCEQCHVEADWKTIRRFDHSLTRFPLLGKHDKVKCEKCHVSPQFKDAKSDCWSCHEKDDKHKRRFGTLCEDCHNARDWKAWDFDHDKRTKFALDGGHKGIDCHACHKAPITGRATLPTGCASCHNADDVHGGSFGKQCERCHVSSKWSRIKDRVGAAQQPGAWETFPSSVRTSATWSCPATSFPEGEHRLDRTC